MKTQYSEFILDDIFILQCNINFIPPKEDESLPILATDVDFDILSSKEKNKFKILLKLSYNMERVPEPGCSFSILCESNFSFADIGKLTKANIDNYLLLSGLPLIINYLRSYISLITSSFPFGPLLLPTIDLNNLIHNKGQELISKNPKSRKKKNLAVK